jgi:transposase
MPIVIKLPSNFYNYDFNILYKSEQNPKNKIRLLAMLHLQEGKSLQSISEALKTPYPTIHTWLQNFRKNGLKGLYIKTTRYKVPKITDDIKNWIAEFMKKLYSSEVGGSITGKQLLSIVKKHFNVECCLQTIYNTLHSLNLSWISCRSKHPKSDLEVQELYKKTLVLMSKS